MSVTAPLVWNQLVFETADREVYAPRPASLLLAEEAIRRVRPGERVLDACTGSGVVAIAVARHGIRTTVVAADVNPAALEATHRNARANGVALEVVSSDLYGAFPPASFDVITVHPPAVPYPPAEDWGLSRGMRIATDGGDDGSELVLRSIAEAPARLRPGGRLLLLLPHWSHVGKARAALAEHYADVRELARRTVEFFPAREGRPDEPLLRHVRRLAEEGAIEMSFDGDVPLSVVSVIEARRRDGGDQPFGSEA